MKQYNYKCVVTKNGVKMYYKRVRGNWKRISNKVGMKAEKGKRKYKLECNVDTACPISYPCKTDDGWYCCKKDVNNTDEIDDGNCLPISEDKIPIKPNSADSQENYKKSKRNWVQKIKKSRKSKEKIIGTRKRCIYLFTKWYYTR